MKKKPPTSDHPLVKRRRVHESRYSKELCRLVDSYKAAMGEVSPDEIRRAIGLGEVLSNKQLNILARVFEWSDEDKALIFRLRDERKRLLEPSWMSDPITEVADRTNSQILMEKAAVGYGLFPEVIDQSEVLRKHHAYYGNEGLLERIRDFCLAGDGEGRYLLLEGNPLSGKSALACELVRTLPNRPAYFFIQQRQGHWGESKTIFGSLAAQIVRNYKLPEAIHRADISAADLFFDVLRLAASRAAAARESVVVLIDGLDMAFGPLREDADGASIMPLPVPPPRNCRIIVTSRPGKHLEQLRNVDCCEAVPLEASQRDQIKQWIVKENRTRNLALDQELVDGLAETAQGIFGVPVWLLRERSRLQEELKLWKDNLDALPRGLDGLLDWEWQRLVMACERRGIAEADCRHLLGLLALARKPLSWGAMQAMLLGFGRLDDHGAFAGLDIKDAVRVINPSRLPERFEQLFDCSREYFSMEPSESKGRQLEFFHDFFAEFLESLLDRFAEKDFANQLLAGICADRRNEALQDYRIKYRFTHIFDLQKWQTGLASAFADEEFVIASLEKQGAGPIHRNAAVAAKKSSEAASTLSMAWRSEFEEWELFLRQRVRLLSISPKAYRQEVANEFIRPSGGSDSRQSGGLRKVLESEMLSAPWRADLFVTKRKGGKALRSQGHRSAINAVALSPDGSRLATGGAEGLIKVWDLGEGKLMADLIGHTRAVNSVAWSGDGNTLASGSTDGTVRLWDAWSGGEILKFEPVHEEKIGEPVVDYQSGMPFVSEYGGQFEPVSAVALSSDGKTLASGDADGVVRLWSVEARKHLETGRGHSNEVLDLVFAPETNLLASASADGTLRLWNSVNLAPMAVSAPKTEAPSQIAFCSDGETVVSRSEGMPLRFWTRRNGGLFVVSRKGIPGVSALPFAKDPERFLKRTETGTFKFKHFQVGRDLSLSQTGLMTLSGDGHWIMKAGGGQPLTVIDSRNGEPTLQSIHGRRNVVGLEASWDGKRVAMTDGSHTRILDAGADSLLAERPAYYDEEIRIFSRDGTKLAIGNREGTLRIWDFLSDDEIQMDTGKRDERSSFSTVAFFPKDDWICAGNAFGNIKMWNAGNGAGGAEASPIGAEILGAVVALVVSHCGNFIGSVYQDGSVKIWKFERTISLGSGAEAEDTPCDWLRDYRTFPPLEQNRLPVKIVRSEYAVIQISTSVPMPIAEMSFSRDGKYLLTAQNKTVRVWDWQADKSSVLFFSCAVQGVAFQGTKEAEFLVLDEEGQTFVYEIMSKPKSAN